jgi:hypothetical protein
MSLLTASRPGSSARLTLQLYCVEVIHRPSHLRTSRVPITSCLAPCLAPCLARPQRVGRLGHVRRQPPSPLHRPARRTHQSTVLRHTYPGAMSAPMGPLWPRVYSLPCVTPLSEWQTLGSDPQISTTHTDKLPYFPSSCIARQPWNRITSFRLGHTNPCPPTRFDTLAILKLQPQVEAKLHLSSSSMLSSTVLYGRSDRMH